MIVCDRVVCDRICDRAGVLIAYLTSILAAFSASASAANRARA